MPVKKTENRPKIAFTGTFHFHGEKKRWLKLYEDVFFRRCKNGGWNLHLLGGMGRERVKNQTLSGIIEKNNLACLTKNPYY